MKTLIQDKPSKHYIKWFLILIVFFSLFCTSAYGVKSWFDKHGLQSPVILRSPIYNKTAPQPTAKPKKVSNVPDAKKDGKGAVIAQAVTDTQILATSPHTESWYELFIYEHESGNDPTRVNAQGCVGIGQDCSGNLRIQCPNLDYACEETYFTEYMLRRYGSWKAAYEFGMSKGTVGINGGWGFW